MTLEDSKDSVAKKQRSDRPTDVHSTLPGGDACGATLALPGNAKPPKPFWLGTKPKQDRPQRYRAVALAEGNSNPSNLARHVGTFRSQLFKHGDESSPKISLVMERKVAMGSASWRAKLYLCQAASYLTWESMQLCDSIP